MDTIYLLRALLVVFLTGIPLVDPRILRLGGGNRMVSNVKFGGCSRVHKEGTSPVTSLIYAHFTH